MYNLCRNFVQPFFHLVNKLLQDTMNDGSHYRSLFLGRKCTTMLGCFSWDRKSQAISSSSRLVAVLKASRYNWFKILLWSSSPRGIWGCTGLVHVINLESPTFKRYARVKYRVTNFLLVCEINGNSSLLELPKMLMFQFVGKTRTKTSQGNKSEDRLPSTLLKRWKSSTT